MAAVDSIDSNAAGVRWALEASPQTLPGSPVWNQAEPNNNPEVGPQVTTTARNPISDDYQARKGKVTDLSATGAWSQDVTLTNLSDLLLGFMRAAYRKKGEEVVTAVDEDSTNPDEYEVADTTGFAVDDLIYGSGFTNAANNALNVVSAIVSNTSVEVADGQLTGEASPPSDAKISVVGHQFQSGEVDIDTTSGNYPRIVRASGSKDFTDYGLLPGELIWVGDDSNANYSFANAANNGLKRVRSVAETYIELDKSASSMVAETGTGLTVRLFFGTVIKNEASATDRVDSTYQIELTMGAPDDASPSQIQALYVEGCTPGQLTLNMPIADKMTVDFSFQGYDTSTVDGPTSLKTGSRPETEDSEALNTGSDLKALTLALHSTTDEAPTPLCTWLRNLSLVINNNLNPKKALTRLGAIGMSYGTFQVTGSALAYLQDMRLIDAIRANSDATLHGYAAVENAGFAFDMPLLTLGEGRPDVSQNDAITQPVSFQAARGNKIDTTLNHTLLWVFFPYLPDIAEA